ncbi:MAG: 50S ribosomal protein L11 methyltransferase [Deltaproteobacteria bacterium]|nr:50S ribosomal protein L11 methyltransferase [Deltaproteobacteria bacterium]MBW2343796.1 50S ribosomal protein L11 methyltransferase [Deltaproteobacteria bacterium]
MTSSTPQRTGWLEISIRIDPVSHESLGAFLFDLGCTGIVLENFRDSSLKAYLPFQENLEDLRNRLKAFLRKLAEIFPQLQSPELTISRIDDQDWSRNWQRFFHPDRVTPKLSIWPAWEPVPASINGRVIRIDPGPAFGTGQHATTRMCLEAMEKIVRADESRTLLDVGTGSGILAMYGAMLGAKRIFAIDTDPEALRWAKQNIDLNGLTGSIELSSIPIEQIEDSFSLLVANLILGEILEIFPHFPRLLNPNGLLLLSGILDEQVEQVKSVLDSYGLCEHEILFQEEWACVIAKKSNKEQKNEAILC